MRIISSHNLGQQIFENWSMAFVRINRDLKAKAVLFPSDDKQSNVVAISIFYLSVRKHIVSGAAF